MTNWIETYRGSVKAWECDMTEHFTVAYYFDRFADAALRLMEHHGIGISYMREQRHGNATVDCFVRYLRELRAGAAFHIESAVIGVDDRGVRAGHRVIDSATGELCTTMEQYFIHLDLEARKAVPMPAPLRARVEAARTDWDGPERELRAEPEGDAGFANTYRDTTRPWEVDVVGHVGFQFYIHRFSSAGAQIFAQMGLTPDYLREHRLGFSTFEFQTRFRRELNAGDLVDIRTALLHLGGSSIRILHRLYNAGTGTLSASLDQYGVLLDLDKRRPTRISDEIRERAAPFLVKAD